MPNFRLNIRYLYGTIRMENCLHYTCGSTSSPEDLILGFENAVQGELLALLSSKVTVDEYNAVDLNSLQEATIDVNEVGLRQGDCLPPQCTQNIQLKTSFASRSKNGRIFLPGVPEGGQNEGIISAEQKILIGTFASAALAFTWNSKDFQLVIYSRRLQAFTPVETTLYPDFVFTQRRRGYGRGT